MKKTRKKAFTLIELMIVIAIIAILAAVLVPNFIRAQRQGRLSACEANLKNISTALEMYAVDNDGQYPVSVGSSSVFITSYLPKAPECPAARAKYKYSPDNTNGNMYTVACPSPAKHGLKQGSNSLTELYFDPAKGLVVRYTGSQPSLTLTIGQ